MTRRVAIYCRISRDKAGGGLGVDRQREDCEALAARLGWQVVRVYTDNDLSAYSGKPRPEYRALLKDLRSGLVNAVIAWHTDRLHRRPTELEEFIGICEQHGVAVQTVRAGEVNLATPSGRATARTLGAWARHEVEHSIDRQKNAKAQAARNGWYRGGRRPFGYEKDGVTARKAEAAAVADASQRVLHGESLGSIARDWNGRGITTSTGARWTSVSVRDVLIRHRNAALIDLDGGLVEAQWTAIVAPEMWRAVRTLLTEPGRRRPRSNELRWLGSGLYLCGVCDDGTTMRNAMTSGTKRAAYRCKAGAHLVRVAEHVDAYVEELVFARLGRPDALKLLTPADDGTAARLREESSALQRGLDRLADDYHDGTLDKRQYNRLRLRDESKLTVVENQLSAAVGRSPLEGLVGAADVRATWESFPVSRRKAVVSTLMTVTLLKAPRGRRPDGGYFDPGCVRIDGLTD